MSNCLLLPFLLPMKIHTALLETSPNRRLHTMHLQERAAQGSSGTGHAQSPGRFLNEVQTPAARPGSTAVRRSLAEFRRPPQPMERRNWLAGLLIGCLGGGPKAALRGRGGAAKRHPGGHSPSLSLYFPLTRQSLCRRESLQRIHRAKMDPN